VSAHKFVVSSVVEIAVDNAAPVNLSGLTINPAVQGLPAIPLIIKT